MDVTFDRVALELKKLGSVNRNARIRKAKDGGIAFEEDSYLTPVKRYLNGDSRVQCVRDVESILKQAFELIRAMLNNRYLSPRVQSDDDTGVDTSYDDEHRQLTERLGVMYHGLEKAIVGIQNLCETYRDDKEVVTELTYRADKIKLRLRDMETKCHFLNNPFSTYTANHSEKNFSGDE